MIVFVAGGMTYSEIRAGFVSLLSIESSEADLLRDAHAATRYQKRQTKMSLWVGPFTAFALPWLFFPDRVIVLRLDQHHHA